MPRAILRELGPFAARLVGSLMDERRPSRPDDFREVERIAADACLSVWTARNLLRRLCHWGLVTVPRQGAYGSWATLPPHSHLSHSPQDLAEPPAVVSVALLD